ncbi:HNH endonuclease [Micromonospora sp. CPCC 205371]|nr:HNH endonuclease [Micromonospora sp. CPCC 205371]
MPTPRTYGEITGYPVGSTFRNRTELAQSQVHRPLQGGICGGKDGAESIVVSGGYIDDEDFGDEILYTGQGGNDPNTKRQIAHQQLTLGNAGLVRSQLEGYPVRVVRGAQGDPVHSPVQGFRYDGLFRVADHWSETGVDGFRIWRFRLVELESSDRPRQTVDLARPVGPAGRAEAVIQRLIRSTPEANAAKRLNDYRCQVCGLRLETPTGPYAEAAHIRALGRPHDGPDRLSNILCLCPNHHVLFDTGAIVVDDDGIVRDAMSGKEIGKLRVDLGHAINFAQLTYHRQTHKR